MLARARDDDARLRLRLASAEETAAFAAALAGLARVGDAIGLRGGLGTGKTVFARAFVNARAAAAGLPAFEVPSPTFTLVQTYEVAGVEVHHFDLYRLEREEDAIELGFEDAAAQGIVLVEWPDRLGALRPAEMLDIEFAQGAAADEREAALDVPPGWRARIGGGLERWRA